MDLSPYPNMEVKQEVESNRSNIGIWSDIDIIYSSDIGQWAPIHITKPQSIL